HLLLAVFQQVQRRLVRDEALPADVGQAQRLCESEQRERKRAGQPGQRQGRQQPLGDGYLTGDRGGRLRRDNRVGGGCRQRREIGCGCLRRLRGGHRYRRRWLHIRRI